MKMEVILQSNSSEHNWFIYLFYLFMGKYYVVINDYNKINELFLNLYNILDNIIFMGIGDWGLGIGDWGLGIGDWGQSPIPIFDIKYIKISKY